MTAGVRRRWPAIHPTSCSPPRRGRAVRHAGGPSRQAPRTSSPRPAHRERTPCCHPPRRGCAAWWRPAPRAPAPMRPHAPPLLAPRPPSPRPAHRPPPTHLGAVVQRDGLDARQDHVLGCGHESTISTHIQCSTQTKRGKQRWLAGRPPGSRSWLRERRGYAAVHCTYSYKAVVGFCRPPISLSCAGRRVERKGCTVVNRAQGGRRAGCKAVQGPGTRPPCQQAS